MADHRDLVIDILAESEAELRARVADLEADNAVLRETLHAAMDLAHTLTEQNARLRVSLRRDLWERYGAVIPERKAA